MRQDFRPSVSMETRMVSFFRVQTHFFLCSELPFKEVVMLVLSRRQDQTVCFPNLGIEVTILKIAGNAIRIGVAAPNDVLVLRGELPQPPSSLLGKELQETNLQKQSDQGFSIQPDAELLVNKAISRFRHDVRNRLNAACLILEVLQRKIESQNWDQTETLIERALTAFHAIDEELENHKKLEPAAHTGRPRILIVEDNINEGQLLAEYLSSFECDVTVVSNGRLALHDLRQNGKPDLVILDMNMPTLDGPSTIRMIREQSEFDGLRIYGVSGLQPDEAGVSIGPDGADKWYTKPIKVKSLVQEFLSTIAQSTKQAEFVDC
jgi:carbon storage regulator CsrA